MSDVEYFTGHSDDCDGKCGGSGISSNQADYCEQYRQCLGAMPWVRWSKMEGVLKRIAEGEYGANGRCFWCDGWPKNTHRNDCPSTWARETIKDVFPGAK